MENEVLAPGQIELTAESTVEAFRPVDVEICEANGLTPEDVLQFVKESGSQTLNAAIGGMSTATNRAASELEPVPEGEVGMPEGFEKHEVTEEDIENNPELKDQGVEVGDKIGIPAEVEDEKLPSEPESAE